MGRVIALALVRHDWDVTVHCHRLYVGAGVVAAEITAMDRRATVLQADLSGEAAAGRLITDCSAILGTPTCLINNVSLFQYDVTTGLSYASLDTHTRINVTVPLLLSRELRRVPIADGAEHRGVIINLLDQRLGNLSPDFFSYTLSRAALLTATMQPTQALASMLRVVGAASGATMVSGNQLQGGFAYTYQMTPLDQSSTPEDVAGAVCYLTTARTITSTILFVDGGQRLILLARDVMFLTE